MKAIYICDIHHSKISKRLLFIGKKSILSNINAIELYIKANDYIDELSNDDVYNLLNHGQTQGKIDNFIIDNVKSL